MQLTRERLDGLTNLDSCELPLNVRVACDAGKRSRHDSNEQIDEYHRTTEEVNTIHEQASKLGDAVTFWIDVNRLVSSMFDDCIWKDDIGIRLRLEAVK